MFVFLPPPKKSSALLIKFLFLGKAGVPLVFKIHYVVFTPSTSHAWYNSCSDAQLSPNVPCVEDPSVAARVLRTSQGVEPPESPSPGPRRLSDAAAAAGSLCSCGRSVPPGGGVGGHRERHTSLGRPLMPETRKG